MDRERVMIGSQAEDGSCIVHAGHRGEAAGKRGNASRDLAAACTHTAIRCGPSKYRVASVLEASRTQQSCHVCLVGNKNTKTAFCIDRDLVLSPVGSLENLHTRNKINAGAPCPQLCHLLLVLECSVVSYTSHHRERTWLAAQSLPGITRQHSSSKCCSARMNKSTNGLGRGVLTRTLCRLLYRTTRRGEDSRCMWVCVLMYRN